MTYGNNSILGGPVAKQRPPISPGTILLLDDDVALLTALEELCTMLWPEAKYLMIERLGQAIPLLGAQCCVDLVIADLRLPDAPPDVTMPALLALVPPDVPLIVLSGSVWVLEGYEMLRGGADAFILKGGDTFALGQTILHTWLGHCGRQARAVEQADVARLPAATPPAPGAPLAPVERPGLSE